MTHAKRSADAATTAEDWHHSRDTLEREALALLRHMDEETRVAALLLLRAAERYSEHRTENPADPGPGQSL